MKIAVIGSRDFEGIDLIDDYLDSELSMLTELSLISGGASGVDAVAKAYARSRAITFIELKADWKAYGRAAGPIRNKQIIDMADSIYAFWDERSKGTAHVMEYALRIGKPCQVVVFAGVGFNPKLLKQTSKVGLV